jgi:hypothetical protein
MDSTDLTAEQWQQLSDKFLPMVRDLTRLIGRMQERKFPEDDAFFKMVWDTQAAVSNLQSHAHKAAYDLAWKAKHQPSSPD